MEQERELLAPFFARAEQGEIATAGEIKRVFEAQVGARRSMKAPSIACCIDIGGASWFRARAIPRPTRKSKPPLKKLSSKRPGGNSDP